MYLNFYELYSSDYSIRDLMTLIAIRQKEDDCLINQESAAKLEKANMIEQQRNGAYKLTPKAMEFISVVETPGLTEEVSLLLDYLIELYRAIDKDPGITKEIERRLIWFMGTTGFSAKVIKATVEKYLRKNNSPAYPSMNRQADDKKYIMSLANLIWKPQSVAFSVHMKLSESKLFDLVCLDYSISSKFYFEDKKPKDITWLLAVSRLPDPPAKLPAELSFTGSGKSDKERLKQLKTELYKKLKEVW